MSREPAWVGGTRAGCFRGLGGDHPGLVLPRCGEPGCPGSPLSPLWHSGCPAAGMSPLCHREFPCPPPVPALCLGVLLSLFPFNVPLSLCVPRCPPSLSQLQGLVAPHLILSLPTSCPPQPCEGLAGDQTRILVRILLLVKSPRSRAAAGRRRASLISSSALIAATAPCEGKVQAAGEAGGTPQGPPLCKEKQCL